MTDGNTPVIGACASQLSLWTACPPSKFSESLLGVLDRAVTSVFSACPSWHGCLSYLLAGWGWWEPQCSQLPCLHESLHSLDGSSMKKGDPQPLGCNHQAFPHFTVELGRVRSAVPAPS